VDKPYIEIRTFGFGDLRMSVVTVYRYLTSSEIDWMAWNPTDKIVLVPDLHRIYFLKDEAIKYALDFQASMLKVGIELNIIEVETQ
jgi:hypothetical protein